MNQKYGEILYDKELYFHTVGFDIWKLDSILMNGILSQLAAKEKGIDIGSKNGSVYNGNTRVSLCVSPSIYQTFEPNTDAKYGEFPYFAEHITTGLSFIIENPANLINMKPNIMHEPDIYFDVDGHSGYIDEIHAGYKVDASKIIGVMVPKNWESIFLSDLPITIHKDPNTNYQLICRFVESITGMNIMDEEVISLCDIYDSLDVSTDTTSVQMRKSLIERISSRVQFAYKKAFEDSNQTIFDYIRQQVNETLPIYDHNGHSMENSRPIKK